MKKSPVISIVIPVYNVEKYLEKCIDSVVNQTFEDIEIICINDCSTDSSLNILKEYAKTDSRVTVIDKPENEGTMLARKDGVDAAAGEYIVFLDSDDYIDLKLCEFISEFTLNQSADIIHFSSGVDAISASGNYEALVNAVKPYEKTLTGEDILVNAFIKKTFANQLWGKAYKADFCKKVHSLLPYERCYVGEDVFVSFFLAMFAQKYIGVKTPPYYWYRFGLGVSGAKTMPLAKFEMFSKMANWVKYAEEYFVNHKTTDMQKKAFEMFRKRMFDDCCGIYSKNVPDKLKIKAEELIYINWKDISVDDKEWEKNIGKSKEYIKRQTEIEEYVISNSAFSENVPKVSVVVPIYNNNDCLPAFFESVIKQTEKDIEIIIINDGSEDSSENTIKALCQKDNRITFANQKHYGLSNAKNFGLKQAKAEYIYFADVERALPLNFIENLYIKAKDVNADIVWFNAEDIDEDVYVGEEILYTSIKKNIAVSDISTKLIRKELIEKTDECFEEKLYDPDKLFLPVILGQADRVAVISEKYLDSKNIKITDKINKIDEYIFIEYFTLYTMLTSKVITSKKYSESLKIVLTELSKKYRDVSNEIYMNLTSAQCSKVNKSISSEYRPLYSNIRELKNIKDSATYRVGDKLTSIPRKLLSKK